MSSIFIYGGVYTERCILPHWNQIFGSAGRAIAVLSNLNDYNKTLVCYANDKVKDYLDYFKNIYNSELIVYPNEYNISFSYLHTLSKPQIFSNKNYIENKNNSICINEDFVICYGTLESDAPLVNGKKAIYDFQSSKLSDLFHSENKIEEICFIINLDEAKYISNQNDIKSIKEYFFKEFYNLKILVIKDGAFGGYVFHSNKQYTIPIYKTNNIFKVGSGDTFTAIFAYEWIKSKDSINIENMIELASFATAYYSENYNQKYQKNFFNAFLENKYEKIFINRSNFYEKNKVYLAGPFFNTSQRWHIEDTKNLLEKFEFDVFSPIHEVGEGEANYIAMEDLKGLDESDSVFAILNGYDPGTVFEIGYAIAKEKKVFLFSEQKDEVNLTMFKGTDCKIFNDITTAIYNLVWEMSVK